MNRVIAILFSLAFMFAGMTFGQSGAPTQAPNDSKAGVRFIPVEIWIETGAEPLAAYQIEFKPVQSNAKIVGIEGGEHAAFANPPYYDPKAMMSERVIIAAYNIAAAADLPSGKVRVATIHVQATGPELPEFSATLSAAASVDGKSIPATVEWRTQGDS